MKKVLLISPETYPQVKVGGLGKVTAGLYRGLGKLGVDVKIVSSVKNIYTPLNKKETEMNNRCLGRRAVVMCRREDWYPDWVWCHDWGGVWSMDEFKQHSVDTKACWTVHSPINLAGYGYEYGYQSSDEAIDWGDDFFDFKALVERGINLADKVTTVSNGYAKSLKSNELFAQTRVDGVGLGLNLDDWSAKKNDLITNRLNSGWSVFKRANKEVVQRIFALPRISVPMFVFVSRLVPQKGLDLLLDVLPQFLGQNDVQFVFLGDGRREYKERLRKLAKVFANKLAVKLEADFELPHQIYAGGDYLVLPSVTEPFGLVVAEAKRYGAMPIVYKVDGLADQVTDSVNGFVFDKYNKDGLMKKLIEAVEVYGSDWQKGRRPILFKDVVGEVEMSQNFLSLLYAD